jgi:undecaprenyl-diphosphatase
MAVQASTFDLNVIDAAGLALVERLAHRSVPFDWAVNFLLTVDLVKFGVPVGLMLFALLSRRARETAEEHAARAAFSLLGMLLAIGFGRAVQDGLPPRPRPRQGLPGFDFPPIGDLPNLAEWSSFPSDHAGLAAALATVAFAYSWRLGLVSAAWGVLVVAFPRLYFGYHYATDLIGGAVYGVAITAAVLALRRPGALGRVYAWLQARYPVLLLLGLFVMAYEMVGLFQTTRRGLQAMEELLQALG